MSSNGAKTSRGPAKRALHTLFARVDLAENGIVGLTPQPWARDAFGMEPTPWATLVSDQVAAYRGRG